MSEFEQNSLKQDNTRNKKAPINARLVEAAYYDTRTLRSIARSACLSVLAAHARRRAKSTASCIGTRFFLLQKKKPIVPIPLADHSVDENNQTNAKIASSTGLPFASRFV